jgi:EAL domain-containing protein (putative c-di-GMP-specific phosphodiesterase class I)
LPAEQLQLELTESAFIHDVEGTQAHIARLRRTGVKVAIDDFGAGQASLSYLTTFTVDTVKIDRSLVQKVAEDPRTARLVAGMIQLFEGIELRTVAEGVETAEQYVHLESAGRTLTLRSASAAADLAGGVHVAAPLAGLGAALLDERLEPLEVTLHP